MTKRTDDCRQGVTRLGMRCGNGELAHALIGAFLSDLFNGPGLPEHLIGHINDLLAHLGDLGQMLAAAHKDLNAQLIFQ